MSALILISVLGVLVLYLGIFAKKGVLAPVSILGLLGVMALFWTGWKIPHEYLGGMLEFDGYSTAFNLAMLAITVLIFLFGPDYYKRMERHVAEQYALMMFSLTGGFILSSYNNLLMLFLGYEILSIPLYVLAGAKKYSLRSSEASLKYFLLGSFASAFMLMGIALLYSLTGTFEMGRLGEYMLKYAGSGNLLLNFGLFFVVVGLAFKVGAAPFHFWVPDVYTGSPTLVTTFMATVVKMAGFAGFYRLIAVTGMPDTLATTLALLVLATLLLGNVAALRQTNFKRLMAYSSVSHAGFLLLAVLADGAAEGTGLSTGGTLLFYTFTYSLATVGLFILFIIAKRANQGAEHNGIFQGLWNANPWLALCGLALLLSMAGIPLTAGFIAKYQVFLLAIKAGWLKVMGFGVLMALLGVYYYIMVAKAMFTPAAQPVTFVAARLNWLVITLCTVGILLLGLWPSLVGL
ncbi:MAG TPA: NADH-quinone oxidoreductase subunit N [Flavobacteriales bacterium]|nr:NADH-quinone oxidoreductase subunit N [Flavobacteriales bacterium]